MHIADYAGPPTWAVALRILSEHPEGLTRSELQVLVCAALTNYITAPHWFSVGQLNHLAEDGCVDFVREPRQMKRRRGRAEDGEARSRGCKLLKVYRCTEAGREALRDLHRELAVALAVDVKPKAA